MYSSKDKMYSLIANEHQAIDIIGRFGIPLGVGDKTIGEVCQEQSIHCETFLSIINYRTSDAAQQIHYQTIDLRTLMRYLRNAHSYFFEFSLPMLRQKLIESINLSTTNSQIPILIIKFFDEYVENISVHMQHENEQLFPYIESLLAGERPPQVDTALFEHQHKFVDDQHIASTLSELKNLIIKYYPQTEQNYLLGYALNDIFQTEENLAIHCAIEEDLLFPAAKHLEKRLKERKRQQDEETGTQIREELSDREKDVLIQVVKGLSNKEIADVLCISTHTVISHRKNITRKLNIRSTAGLTIYAIVNHLIDINNLSI